MDTFYSKSGNKSTNKETSIIGKMGWAVNSIVIDF